jgi:ATP-dependent exoDNAse (exonuclease V) beta subunit
MCHENKLSKEDCDHLGPLAERLLDDSTYQNWMSSAISIYNEAWIMNQEFEIIRPDKIIETPNEILIIDFKTGEKHDHHKAQLKKYERDVQDCFKHEKPISCLLYYAQSSEWVSC